MLYTVGSEATRGSCLRSRAGAELGLEPGYCGLIRGLASCLHCLSLLTLAWTHLLVPNTFIACSKERSILQFVLIKSAVPPSGHYVKASPCRCAVCHMVTQCGGPVSGVNPGVLIQPPAHGMLSLGGNYAFAPKTGGHDAHNPVTEPSCVARK